jgi:hypothetical protein
MRSLSGNGSPGFRSERLVRLMQEAIQRCHLDLSGKAVLTEAATGAYLVTPVLAAMAGARRVYAVTRNTRYGTVEETSGQTMELARMVSVHDRVEILTAAPEEVVSRADIVTNSGHVRPIGERMISWMRPGTVVPLMYEAWEFRAADVDLQACAVQGVACAGTNERHPAIDVFSYLGMMAAKLLLDAGLAVYRSRILLLCDNPFAPYIASALNKMDAVVQIAETLYECDTRSSFDAVLVALKPRSHPVMTQHDAEYVAANWPDTVVVQFWGDLDRAALTNVGLPVWPTAAPGPGHMGILPSGVGPEPIVRLQAGGLKVGEVLSKPAALQTKEDLEYVQTIG